mmetsp:Transcript_49860/g.115802  ORF Transcript_49860/g.115802 Transcript_49860/m.115802 type:complete len:573 (-) Transcript_49860:75-1793(-)
MDRGAEEGSRATAVASRSERHRREEHGVRAGESHEIEVEEGRDRDDQILKQEEGVHRRRRTRATATADRTHRGRAKREERRRRDTGFGGDEDLVKGTDADDAEHDEKNGGYREVAGKDGAKGDTSAKVNDGETGAERIRERGKDRAMRQRRESDEVEERGTMERASHKEREGEREVCWDTNRARVRDREGLRRRNREQDYAEVLGGAAKGLRRRRREASSSGSVQQLKYATLQDKERRKKSGVRRLHSPSSGASSWRTSREAERPKDRVEERRHNAHVSSSKRRGISDERPRDRRKAGNERESHGQLRARRDSADSRRSPECNGRRAKDHNAPIGRSRSRSHLQRRTQSRRSRSKAETMKAGASTSTAPASSPPAIVAARQDPAPRPALAQMPPQSPGVAEVTAAVPTIPGLPSSALESYLTLATSSAAVISPVAALGNFGGRAAGIGYLGANDAIGAFCRASGVDQRAEIALRGLPPHLAAEVVAQGPIFGVNASAILMVRVHKAEQQNMVPKLALPRPGAPALWSSTPGYEHFGDPNAAFMSAYGVDSSVGKAASALRALPPELEQQAIL